jgi:hypothetical protein
MGLRHHDLAHAGQRHHRPREEGPPIGAHRAPEHGSRARNADATESPHAAVEGDLVPESAAVAPAYVERAVHNDLLARSDVLGGDEPGLPPVALTAPK